jgi:hypothetical protein
MTFYTIATEAIRSAVLAKEPLRENESLSVHIREAGCKAVVIRARTDRPEIISEKVYGIDDSL